MVKSLQSLRFFFALLIFTHHFFIPRITVLGLFPVEFFFVLSGFVMSIGYNKRILDNKFNYQDYISRRVTKTFPIHWFALFLAIFVKMATMNINYRDFLSTLLPNLALLQSWIPIKKYYFSFNSPSWFLSDILFIYAIFPLLLKSFNKWKYLPVVILIVYAVVVYICPINKQHAFIYINPLSRTVDFMLGMLLYNCLSEKHIINTTCHIQNLASFKKSIIEIFVVFMVLVFMVTNKYADPRLSKTIMCSVPVIILIYTFYTTDQGGGIISSFLNKHYLIKLGEISMPLFMFHVPIIWIYKYIMKHMDWSTNSIVGFICCLGATILISYLYTVYLESNLQQYFNRLLSKLWKRKLQ